jgi:hypothetical protein
MTRRCFRKLWMAAASAFALWPFAAPAFTPVLAPGDFNEARTAGAQQADSKTHGYVVKDYVLYDTRQPLTIPPGAGEVEAVIVGTPFERLRYASYLASLQGKPMTPQQSAALARELDESVHFVVFAHSPGVTEADRSFLERYTQVVFTLDTGESLAPLDSRVFGPARDFYIVPGSGRERRWLGTVTWKFSHRQRWEGLRFPRRSAQLSLTVPAVDHHSARGSRSSRTISPASSGLAAG